MPSKSSSSSSKSFGKTTGNNNNNDALSVALKHRQRNASSKGGRGGGSSSSSTRSRYWLYWASIVTAAAVSVFLAQHQYGNNSSNAIVVLSQAEQLGEISEDEVITLWKQNCARGAVTNVDVVPFNEMTTQRFHREYLLPRKAVVIAGAYASSPLTAQASVASSSSNEENEENNDNTSSHSSSSRWSFSGIRQAYGHVMLKTLIPLKRGQNVNCTPSGLCKGPIMTLAELFDATFLLPMSERIRRQRNKQQQHDINTADNAAHVNAYPHDIDLETTLPGAFAEYQKLSIVTENLHLATRSGNMDRWPSLFLGPATTKTGLHVDNFGTSFTMAVFRGRKQFVLFDAVDGNEHLCLDQPGGGSNYGLVDVFRPNFRACPMATRAHPQFASLGPGDFLYVPGSTHHAARNMDDGIAIAQNFLTISDYHSVVESFKGKSTQSLRRLRNQPVVIPRESIPDYLLVQLDLFKILQETGYYNENYYMENHNSSDDDDIVDDPISFLSVPDSVRLATERVVKHLEKALAREPLLATRVAFLASNPYVVLSLKAAGVWNCLDNVDTIRHEKFLSVSPPAVPLKEVDNHVFNRIRQAVATAAAQQASGQHQQQQQQTFECQTIMRQYVNALETNRQRALDDLEREAGF